ncbi:MAG: hypothetical protein AB7F53_07215 [Nitrososphaeraceae archaeon]
MIDIVTYWSKPSEVDRKTFYAEDKELFQPKTEKLQHGKDMEQDTITVIIELAEVQYFSRVLQMENYLF